MARASSTTSSSCQVGRRSPDLRGIAKLDSIEASVTSSEWTRSLQLQQVFHRVHRISYARPDPCRNISPIGLTFSVIDQKPDSDDNSTQVVDDAKRRTNTSNPESTNMTFEQAWALQAPRINEVQFSDLVEKYEPILEMCMSD